MVLATSGEMKIVILLLAVALALFFGLTVYAYDIRKERESLKKNDKPKD